MCVCQRKKRRQNGVAKPKTKREGPTIKVTDRHSKSHQLVQDASSIEVPVSPRARLRQHVGVATSALDSDVGNPNKV
jgi:hypothetical protein